MRRIIFAFLVMVVGCTSVEEKGLSRPSLSISDAINRDVFVDSVKFQLIKTPEKGLQITESWIEKTKQCALAPSMNYQFVIKFDRRLGGLKVATIVLDIHAHCRECLATSSTS